MLFGTMVYGFINSAILALVAMGFNMTFGISGVANFAYGAIYIFSGFLTWILLNSLGVPYLLSVLLAVLCSSTLGLFMYYAVIVRVKGLALSEVMATFGTGDAKVTAGGIGEALITTFLGLMVAIPIIMVHGVLKSLARTRLGQVEGLALAMINGTTEIEKKPTEGVGERSSQSEDDEVDEDLADDILIEPA